MTASPHRRGPRRTRFGALLALWSLLFVVACVTRAPGDVQLHGWWHRLGPVIPHDNFPSDCSLCHIPDNWQTLQDDFSFDHEAETGVPLIGAHEQAQCLRCHNDRGPVSVFTSQGCAGCHQDIHVGQLGSMCTDCHDQNTWNPYGQLQRHNHTRFPLLGVHSATACRRCHPGAEIGRFVPTDTECATCHQDDLQRAVDPNHLLLGLINRCDRCHQPTTWDQAELDL